MKAALSVRTHFYKPGLSVATLGLKHRLGMAAVISSQGWEGRVDLPVCAPDQGLDIRKVE